MLLGTAPTLTDRFEWLIDGLCKTIGVDAHKRRMEAALAWAIWNRVRLLGDRLIALIARARAGKLAARRTPHPDPPPQGGREHEREPDAGAGAASGAGVRLPTGFGWVTRVLPQTGQYAGLLAYLLRDPEMAALVEKTPQAARILRPLCQLLGVKETELLRPRAGAAEDPAPHLAFPPPGAEKDDDDGAATVEVAPAATVAQASPAAQAAPAAQATTPEPRPYHQRPGGLFWDGRRLQWS